MEITWCETKPSKAVITRILEKSQTNSAPDWIDLSSSKDDLPLKLCTYRGVDVLGKSFELTASRRAQWLAELSAALDDAQDLLWRLAPGELRQVDALDLWARIEGARAELRSLRRARPDDVQLRPEWTNPGPWQSRDEDRAG